MTSSKQLFCVLSLGASLMLASSVASAQQTKPEVPFNEARALMKAGKYAEAIPKLEESLAIKQTGGALLNLADCHEKLGHLATAVETFERARAQFEPNPKDKARMEEAGNRAKALRPLISTLSVKIVMPPNPIPGASPDMATLSIDNKAASADSPTPIDGGEHAISISAQCHEPFTTRVTVAPREEAKVVTAQLVRSKDASCMPAAPPPPVVAPRVDDNALKPVPPPKDDQARGASPLVPILMGVVGLAGIGVGTAFGLSASSKQSDLEAACTNYPVGCPAARRNELMGIQDDASSAATISTTGFIAGGVLLVGAAVLYFATSGSSSSSRGSINHGSHSAALR